MKTELLQKKLEKLEAERNAVENALSDPDVYAHLERFAETATRFQEINDQIELTRQEIEKAIR